MATPDRRSILIDAYENAAVILSGVCPDQLRNATPCPGYDVAGLIDHVVEAGRRAAALGHGQAPPSGDASPHVELTDAPDRLRRTAQEAAAAWADDDRLVTTATMPWGERYTGAALIDMYLLELAVHAWDLARATGQLDRLCFHPRRARIECGARLHQAGVPGHGGPRCPLRCRGTATSGRRRLGALRGVHGTRPASWDHAESWWWSVT